MGQHRTLTIEELSKDELDNILKSGNLSLCPKCQWALQNTCAQNGGISGISMGPLNSDREGCKACRNCGIVWKYKSEKWIKERGDGMIVDEGCHVYVYAISDCFHTKLLIKLFKGRDGFMQIWPEIRKI